MDWNWVPLLSIGSIEFGAESGTLTVVPGIKLEELKSSDGQLWTYYWSEEAGLSVICVERKVVSVACHKALCYRGVNLVGISSTAARMHFRDQKITVGEFPDGYTMEVAALGLELTLIDQVVTIASAFGEPMDPIDPGLI